MARIRRHFIELRGKFDDKVFVGGKTPYVRKTVAPGTKKNEPALKKQYKRSAFLNDLAGDINSIVRGYCGEFKSGQFYQQIQKRFRKEPSNNRFLLLHQLKGMEANPRYKFADLNNSDTMLNRMKNKIVVTLTCKFHPHSGDYKADCYYFDVLLLTWTANSKSAKVQQQFTEWIRLEDKLPEFDFDFTCPNATNHWLLCLRIRLGVLRMIESRRAIEANEAEGVMIKDMGSFVKKDLELLEKNRVKARQKLTSKKKVVNIVRVKPKG